MYAEADFTEIDRPIYSPKQPLSARHIQLLSGPETELWMNLSELYEVFATDADLQQIGLSLKQPLTLAELADEAAENVPSRVVETCQRALAITRELHETFADPTFDERIDEAHFERMRAMPLVECQAEAEQLRTQHSFINECLTDPGLNRFVAETVPEAVRETIQQGSLPEATELLAAACNDYQLALEEQFKQAQIIEEANRIAEEAAAAAAAQQHRQESAAEKAIDKLIDTDGFTDWLEVHGIDIYRAIGEQTPLDLLKSLRPEFKRFREQQRQAEAATVTPKWQSLADKLRAEAREQAAHDEAVTDEFPASSEPASERRSRLSVVRGDDGKLALELVISSPQKPKVLKDEASRLSSTSKRSLGAAAAATALLAGAHTTHVHDGPIGKITHSLQQALSGNKNSPAPNLRPNAPAVATKVATASQMAEQTFHLKADQVVPNNLRLRVLASGVYSADAQVNALGGNPAFAHDEPAKTQLNRSDRVVREIDTISHHLIRGLTHDPDLTPGMVDAADSDAVKAMLAARYPHTVTSEAAHFQPENHFQAEAANRLMQTVLSGPNPYTVDEARHIAGLLALTLDHTTPAEQHAEAMQALTTEAERLVHIKPHEMHVHNPTYTLAEYLAAEGDFESGRSNPVNLTADNGTHYGPWQMSKELWHQPGNGWAQQIFGDANTPMNADTMTMAAVTLWSKNLEQLGSADAAMATWELGPLTGQAIAGRSQSAYNAVMKNLNGQHQDGNGTSAATYISSVSAKLPGIDVAKQLNFLEAVKKRHPHFDWSLLNKRYPLYSELHLKQMQTHAHHEFHRRLTHSAVEHIEKLRDRADTHIVAAAEHELKRNGGKHLETRGPNMGPEIARYSYGHDGPSAFWCAYFATYVMREAGQKLEGAPADKNGSIAGVRYVVQWYKDHGMVFSSQSHTAPHAGELVAYNIFDNTSEDDHIGVVVGVKGHEITTIEGNWGNTVAQRHYNYLKYGNKLVFLALRNPR